MSPPAYDIFISYSHADKNFAARLETALQKYRAPLGSGLKPSRLIVFRDESAASGVALARELAHALAAARKLIVICSPEAYRSHWVSQELGLFIEKRGVENVIPVLVAGMPNDEALRSKRPEESAFPEEFVRALTGVPWSPDFRGCVPLSKRISRAWPGWFHLLAAVYDAPRAMIERKERNRRTNRAVVAAAALLLLVCATREYINQGNQRLSFELADQASALSQPDEFARSMALGMRAIETAPTAKAKIVVRNLLNKYLGEHYVSPSVVAVSPDGTKLAQASPFGGTVLYETLPQARHSLCGFAQPVTYLSFSPDSRMLIAFSQEDGRFSVFDATSARRIGTSDLSGYNGDFETMTVSPDSKSVVIPNGETLELRLLPSTGLVKKLLESRNQSAVLFNSSNRTFATYTKRMTAGGGLVLWDTASGSLVWQADERLLIDYVAFPKSGAQLVAHVAGHEEYFIVGELGSGRKPAQLTRIEPGEFPYISVISEDAPPVDQTMFSDRVSDALAKAHPEFVGKYGRDDTFSLITGGSERLRHLALREVTFSPLGQVALADVLSNTDEVWVLLSLPDLEPHILALGQARARPLFSSSGATLAVGLESAPKYEGRLMVWSAKDGSELWSKPINHLQGYMFSRDGSRLTAWGDTDPIIVYDVASGRQIAKLTENNGSMGSTGAALSDLAVVQVDDAGHRLISRTEHTLSLWDVDNATRLVTLNVFAEDEAQQRVDSKVLGSADELFVEHMKDKAQQKIDDETFAAKASAQVLQDIARRRLSACPGARS